MSLRRWILLVVGLWVVIGAYLLISATFAVRDAEHRIGAARKELAVQAGDAAAAPQLHRTASALKRAHRDLANPVLIPLRYVPVLGRQLSAVKGLSGAGDRVLTVGIDALSRGRSIADKLPKNGAGRVRAAHDLGALIASSRAKLGGLDMGPSTHLFGPIARAHAKFATEINHVNDLLRRADTGATGLERFLTGPTRYLVFGANNAEMRAGSGMFLSAGVLDISDGELHLGPMKSVEQIPQPPADVPLEPDIDRLWGPQGPGAQWRFANMTPRFESTGALVQRMWAATGSPPVDGVLAIDPIAVADLVKATGPQTVDGQSVTAANARRLFLHDQYLTFNPDTQQGERREFLGDVVSEIFASVNAGSVSPRALAAAIGTSSTGRHFLAWSSDKAQEGAWTALGMAGHLTDQSLTLALDNRGGNKLDYFQKIDAHVKTALGRLGSVVTVDLDVTNTVPEGQPQYIAGPNPSLYTQEPNLYVGIASINLPANATKVSLTGGDYSLVDGPDGNTQVVSAWMQISRGETQKLHLTFSLPPGWQTLDIAPSARYPDVTWHAGNLTWTDASSRTITW